MRLDSGKELVTVRTESYVYAHLSLSPSLCPLGPCKRTRSLPTQNSISLFAPMSRWERVRAFVFHGEARIFTYAIHLPRLILCAYVSALHVYRSAPVCASYVCDACPCVARAREGNAHALETDQPRHRTIFERGKKRSRMNFLHNFGSPRRF